MFRLCGYRIRTQGIIFNAASCCSKFAFNISVTAKKRLLRNTAQAKSIPKNKAVKRLLGWAVVVHVNEPDGATRPKDVKCFVDDDWRWMAGVAAF